VAVGLLGGDGVIRGKEALRAYWSEGVRLIPDLRFEVLAVYAGIRTVVINYRNQAGGVVCEVLTFDGPLVIQGHGTYPAQARSDWRGNPGALAPPGDQAHHALRAGELTHGSGP